MYRSLITAAGLLAVATPVHAEETAVVPPVTVSATRTESSVTTPASVTVIDRAAIEASGAQTLTEVLAGQGAVQLKDLYGDGSRATVGMRGLTGGNAASNTLLLVDGRRLNNPDLASPDLSGIRLKDVERIEIIQGSAGTLFGDQAVGGVINVITRRPQGSSGSIEATAGGFDQRRLTGEVTAATAGGLGLRLSGETSRTDNYRHHNARDNDNVLARADYGLSGGGNVFAELQHLHERLELPGGLSAAQMAADRTQADPANPYDYDAQSSDVARIGLRQPLGSAWQAEAELTWRDMSGDGKLWGGAFTQHRRHLGFTPRAVGSLAGDTLVTVGADLDQIDYRFDSQYVASDDTQRTRAVYAQAVVPVTRALGLTMGARHARVDYDVTGLNDKVKDEVTVWELGASYSLTPEWRLFARRDGNFRFPKVDEMTFVSPGATLDTQTGVSYEGGVEWSRGGQRAKAQVYRLDLDNEIDYDSTAPGPWGQGANVNLPKTRRSGAVLEGRTQAGRNLALEAQYTYTDPEMTGGPFAGKVIPFVARNSARLGADLRIADGLSAYGEVIYTGERYQDADYANTLSKLDATTLLNVALRWGVDRWKLTARVDNLTDQRYVGYATYDRYYPAPGRYGWVTVGYSF